MRILMSMFGWNASGGGSIFPQQLALDLQSRGHEVMVIYAALEYLPDQPPYTVTERAEHGIQLIGIHNWPLLIPNWPTDYLGADNPEREIYDPAVLTIFESYAERFQPDIVHYHNLYALSISFLEYIRRQSLPSLFTLHNFWLICPTLYLVYQHQTLCEGINSEGSNCKACTAVDFSGEKFLERHRRLLTACQQYIDRLIVSAPKIKHILCNQGYPESLIEVFKLANQRIGHLWKNLGENRPLFKGNKIRFGYMGSIVPFKGIDTLTEALQALTGDFEMVIYGSGPPEEERLMKAWEAKLSGLHFKGSFTAEEQAEVLAQIDIGIVPSLCHEQAGLVVEEFLAARIPVLVSDRGGLSYYLQPGTGAVFPAENAQELAPLMQALIDQPEKIRTWQAAIQAPTPFAHYVSQMEQLYHQVLRDAKGAIFKRILPEQKLKIACFLTPQNGWQAPLLAYLSQFTASDPVEFVLLPQNLDLAQAETYLLQWLEGGGIDLDAAADIVLLEPIDSAADLGQFLKTVHVFLPPESPEVETPNRYHAVGTVACKTRPEDAFAEEVLPPPLLVPWLEALSYHLFAYMAPMPM